MYLSENDDLGSLVILTFWESWLDKQNKGYAATTNESKTHFLSSAGEMSRSNKLTEKRFYTWNIEKIKEKKLITWKDRMTLNNKPHPIWTQWQDLVGKERVYTD